MASYELHDKGHEARVAEIAARVADLSARGERVHISKGKDHHVVPLPDDPRFRDRPVDISSLRHILQIDPERRTATVEPGVTFRELVDATLRHRLIPCVVPELEGITVGGAVAGCSIEAMSYRYGGFHDTALEYEVITGAGEVLRCSRERERDAFDMIHGSYGTLAILSQATFKLVPAAPFVHMEYVALPTFEAFQRELHERCRAADHELIDGIIHSPRLFVLCLGRFVDSAPYTSDYRRRDIYYKSTAARREDYLTTADYCFRYDAECHWLTRSVPPLEWAPVRRVLGRYFLGSTNLIRWSNRLAPLLSLKRRPDVVCDVFIPAGNFGPFFRWYERAFEFFPLWIVPYRIAEVYPWVAPAHAQRMRGAMVDELVIDCAVYGKPNSDPAIDYSRLLEEKTFELDGVKTLISRNHYSEERFWTIYNRDAYEAAKERLDPRRVFPDLCRTFCRVE